MPAFDLPATAIATLPTGRWVVGVSGGADSVALLRAIVAFRPDIEPIVAHLDHETRGLDSLADARFVHALATSLGLEIVTARRSDFPAASTTNLEASFREARHALFRLAIAKRSASGVLLAHHADDRAETALLRLLRGGEPTAIAGLRRETDIAGLRIVRPLLNVRRAVLEAFLRDLKQPWQTDSTNATDTFARNRVRRFLATREALIGPILALADAAEALGAWTDDAAPDAIDSFIDANLLADLPAGLARRTARRWLTAHGSPRESLSIEVVERLIAMARDRAVGSPQAFPGNVAIHRRGRRLTAHLGDITSSRAASSPGEARTGLPTETAPLPAD